MFMLRFPSQVFSDVLLSPSKTETNKNEVKQMTQASPSVCLWSFWTWFAGLTYISELTEN